MEKSLRFGRVGCVEGDGSSSTSDYLIKTQLAESTDEFSDGVDENYEKSFDIGESRLKAIWENLTNFSAVLSNF